MYKQTGGTLPNCINPWLNCIYDMAGSESVMYIITKHMKYIETVFFACITQPERIGPMLKNCLQGLKFFHDKGFIYKYLNRYTVQLTRKNRINFGFGGDIKDPLFDTGLISQANFKSDIYCLSTVFYNSSFNYKEFATNYEIEIFTDVYHRIYSALFQDGYPAYICSLIARMAYFSRILGQQLMKHWRYQSIQMTIMFILICSLLTLTYKILELSSKSWKKRGIAQR